jgi:3'(2'), 5'-bisphosphate nucleotidase
MEWDTAAGHAIAVAAGCRVYQPGTYEPLRYNKENLVNPWFIVER